MLYKLILNSLTSIQEVGRDQKIRFHQSFCMRTSWWMAPKRSKVGISPPLDPGFTPLSQNLGPLNFWTAASSIPQPAWLDFYPHASSTGLYHPTHSYVPVFDTIRVLTCNGDELFDLCCWVEYCQDVPVFLTEECFNLFLTLLFLNHREGFCLKNDCRTKNILAVYFLFHSWLLLSLGFCFIPSSSNVPVTFEDNWNYLYMFTLY